MKTFRKHIYLIAGLLLLGACKPEINPVTPSKGTADFSKYISVGNSLTAGYADGGLYLEGQENSYPSIIAKQMLAVGGGEFKQPLFSADQANGSGYLRLAGFNTDGTPKTETVTSNLAIRGQIAIPGFGNVTLYNKYTGGEFNNLGVPGIKLQQITYAPYGNLNGFYERMLGPAAPANTESYLDFVTTGRNFTFFSNWLGNNDALGYATSGGAGDVLTDKAVFEQLYNLLINSMTASGAKGVVATVPDVTAVPYFNTVTVSAVLAGVQKVNPAVQALYINAKTGSGLSDGYAPRAATTKDLIVLTFPTSKIGQVVDSPAGPVPYGLTQYAPIENQYVLDENEVTLTEDYIASYNNTIKTAAAAKGLAVFDSYTFLNNVKAHGLLVNGISMSSGYISGGIFSLDGVHLTPRGYAIVANEFIKAINATYKSSIPLADITNYRAVKFP